MCTKLGEHTSCASSKKQMSTMSSSTNGTGDEEAPVANETTGLLAEQEVDSTASPESTSSSANSSDRLFQEMQKPWPSTFERSISLLASPVITGAEAEAFTKSPKPGNTPLAARRQQRMETPQPGGGVLLPPTSRYADSGFAAPQKVKSMDFKFTADSLGLGQESISATMARVEKDQVKKAQEAAEYRKKLLQQQGSGDGSPGYNKEKKSIQRGKKKKAADKAKQSQLDGKATFSECVFNLANILMGVGLLGLPFACASAGWAGGMFAIISFSFVTWKTSIMIGRELNGDPRPAAYFSDSPFKTPLQPGSVPEARMRKPITSFPDIARQSFGTSGSIVLSIVLYFELFSCICIFIVAMADHVHALFPRFERIPLMVAVSVASAVPMLLLRTAKLLAYLSMVGTFATIAVVLSVFSAAAFEGNIAEDVAAKLEPPPEGPFHTAWKTSGLPLAFGLVAYCFSGHAIVPSIYSSMRNPYEFERVVDLTFAIVTLACLLVGLSGYWMFGELVRDQITISLEENSSAATAMTILTYLMVMTAYSKTTLTMFPLALGFEEIVAPYLATEFAVEVASVMIKLILLSLALAVSIFVPSFSFLCAMVGMICTMSVSVIFPAAAHLKLFSSKLSTFEIVQDWIFIIVGLSIAVVGSVLGL